MGEGEGDILFSNGIVIIINDFCYINTYQNAEVAEIDVDESEVDCSLSAFKEVTEEETLKITRDLTTKSCRQDPTPTQIEA